MVNQEAPIAQERSPDKGSVVELPVLYTIGHSNHQVDSLIRLLKSAGITAVVDVRSSPYSQHNPQFNRDLLRKALAAEGVKYYFFGDSLGGKPSDPRLQNDAGEPDYAAIAQSSAFRAGLDSLLELAKTETVTVLCAEEDPDHCHRKRLIADQLTLSGRAEVRHIRRDGCVETFLL